MRTGSEKVRVVRQGSAGHAGPDAPGGVSARVDALDVGGDGLGVQERDVEGRRGNIYHK